MPPKRIPISMKRAAYMPSLQTSTAGSTDPDQSQPVPTAQTAPSRSRTVPTAPTDPDRTIRPNSAVKRANVSPNSPTTQETMLNLAEDQSTGEASPATNSNWHVLAATWLGGMFDGMDSSIFAIVLFPALSEMLHSNSHSVVGMHGSYIIATFMVGWAIGAVLFGALADYIGRARTMTITILIYALCTGLCATATTWWHLAFFRFLVGAGIGGEMGVGAVMLSESWPNKSRAYAIGLMASSLGFGYMCTATLNLLLGHHGWRWLFVAGVVPAFLTLYIRLKLKEPHQYVQVQEQKAAAKAKSHGERNAEEHKLLRLTFLDLLEPECFKKTIRLICLTSVAVIAWWAVLAWIPAWINQLTGDLAVEQRSYAMYFKDTGMILSGFLGGWIISKLGYKRATIYTFVLACASTTGMFLSVNQFGPALLAWVLAVGFFCHIPFVILWSYIPEVFDARIRSTAFGVCFNAGRFAAAAAALGSGALIEIFGGSYALAASSIASIYIIGIIPALSMPKIGQELITEKK